MPRKRVRKNSRGVKPRCAGRADTKAIRIALINRGWTVTELARRVGQNRPRVSQVVHGRLASVGTQRRIARALGVKYAEVFKP